MSQTGKIPSRTAVALQTAKNIAKAVKSAPPGTPKLPLVGMAVIDGLTTRANARAAGGAPPAGPPNFPNMPPHNPFAGPVGNPFAGPLQEFAQGVQHEFQNMRAAQDARAQQAMADYQRQTGLGYLTENVPQNQQMMVQRLQGMRAAPDLKPADVALMKSEVDGYARLQAEGRLDPHMAAEYQKKANYLEGVLSGQAFSPVDRARLYVQMHAPGRTEVEALAVREVTQNPPLQPNELLALRIQLPGLPIPPHATVPPHLLPPGNPVLIDAQYEKDSPKDPQREEESQAKKDHKAARKQAKNALIDQAMAQANGGEPVAAPKGSPIGQVDHAEEIQKHQDRLRAANAAADKAAARSSEEPPPMDGNHAYTHAPTSAAPPPTDAAARRKWEEKMKEHLQVSSADAAGESGAPAASTTTNSPERSATKQAKQAMHKEWVSQRNYTARDVFMNPTQQGPITTGGGHVQEHPNRVIPAELGPTHSARIAKPFIETANKWLEDDSITPAAFEHKLKLLGERHRAEVMDATDNINAPDRWMSAQHEKYAAYQREEWTAG